MLKAMLPVEESEGRDPLYGRCLCYRGWTGARCDQPQIQNAWSSWSSWSACEPVCGGSRQRFRRRRCLDVRGDCIRDPEDRSVHGGPPTEVEQIRVCRPRPCDRYLRAPAKVDEDWEMLQAVTSRNTVRLFPFKPLTSTKQTVSNDDCHGAGY